MKFAAPRPAQTASGFLSKKPRSRSPELRAQGKGLERNLPPLKMMGSASATELRGLPGGHKLRSAARPWRKAKEEEKMSLKRRCLYIRRCFQFSYLKESSHLKFILKESYLRCKSLGPSWPRATKRTLGCGDKSRCRSTRRSSRHGSSMTPTCVRHRVDGI